MSHIYTAKLWDVKFPLCDKCARRKLRVCRGNVIFVQFCAFIVKHSVVRWSWAFASVWIAIGLPGLSVIVSRPNTGQDPQKELFPLFFFYTPHHINCPTGLVGATYVLLDECLCFVLQHQATSQPLWWAGTDRKTFREAKRTIRGACCLRSNHSQHIKENPNQNVIWWSDEGFSLNASNKHSITAVLFFLSSLRTYGLYVEPEKTFLRCFFKVSYPAKQKPWHKFSTDS